MTTNAVEKEAEAPWCVTRARIVASAIRETAQRGDTVTLPIKGGGVVHGPATVALALDEFADLAAEMPDFVMAVKHHINTNGGAGGYLLARLSDVESKLKAMNITIPHNIGMSA